jgi:hypothetical protein
MLKPSETPEDFYTNTSWHRVDHNLRSGIFSRPEPVYLWYATAPRNRPGMVDEGEVTELGVIYGSEVTAPRWGWETVGTVIGGDGDGLAIEIVMRRDVKRAFEFLTALLRLTLKTIAQAALPQKPELRFNDAGNFTILQIADLHFQVQKSPCLDYNDSDGECRKEGGDVFTEEWLSNVIELAKPDLVVLTGDQSVFFKPSLHLCLTRFF